MITKGQWRTFCDRVYQLQGMGYDPKIASRPIQWLRWIPEDQRDVLIVYGARSEEGKSQDKIIYKHPESCASVGNLKMLYSKITFETTMYDLFKNKVEVTDRNLQYDGYAADLEDIRDLYTGRL